MSTAPQLIVTLPGQWFELPIEAEDAPAQLRAFAERVYGTGDDKSAMRALLRHRLEGAVEQARTSRRVAMHLGVSLAEGIPMPAHVTVYGAGIPVSTASDASARSVMDAFVPLALQAEREDAAAGGAAAGSYPGNDDRVFDRGESMILRRPRLRRLDDDTVGELMAMQIDYWITVPGQKRVVLLHVDVIETALHSMMQILFDEVAFAARFETPRSLRDELTASAPTGSNNT